VTDAVVLGAGMAGILAAAVLADRGCSVTLIESDRLADEPAPRRGLPQAHHSHLRMHVRRQPQAVLRGCGGP